MIRKYLFIFCSFLFCLSAFAVGEGRVILNGSAGENQLKLFWLVHGWPDDVAGFNIKRHIKGGVWEQLNANPIYPEISADRNWTDSGLSDEQSEEFQDKFREYEGKLFHPVSRKQFADTLLKVGMRAGDRIRLKNDYNLVIMMGFGYIDNSYTPDEVYEYGLFGVDSSGFELDGPLAVYTSAFFEVDDEKLKVSLKAEKSGGAVKLSWDCSKEVIEQLGLLGFHVYRKANENDDWTQIVDYNLMPVKRSETANSWVYTDSGASSGKSWLFAVAPTNNFQEEFTKSVVKYEPPEALPLPATEVRILKELSSHDIRLEWSIDPDYKERIKGVYVVRFDPAKKSYQPVSEVFPITQTWWDDKTAVLEKFTYSYKLVTVGVDGEQINSKVKSVLRKGPDRPDAVTDLTGEFLMKNGKGFVRLTWGEKPRDSTTEGYLIYDDESKQGKMMLNASRPLLKTNSYDFEIETTGGRDYTFEVEALNYERLGGEKEKVTVYVPVLDLPWIDEFKVSFSRVTGNLKLDWEYPAFKGLKGFKLTLNGDNFKDIDQISGITRSVVISDFPEKDIMKLEFGLQAVNAVSKSDIKKDVFYLSNMKVDRSIKAPESFNAFSEDKDGKRYIGLQWTREDLKEIGIRGYRIEVRHSSEEIDAYKEIIPKRNLCKEHKYTYKVPDKYKSGKLYFRIYGVTDNNQDGLHRVASYVVYE